MPINAESVSVLVDDSYMQLATSLQNRAES